MIRILRLRPSVAGVNGIVFIRATVVGTSVDGATPPKPRLPADVERPAGRTVLALSQQFDRHDVVLPMVNNPIDGSQASIVLFVVRSPTIDSMRELWSPPKMGPMAWDHTRWVLTLTGHEPLAGR